MLRHVGVIAFYAVSYCISAILNYLQNIGSPDRVNPNKGHKLTDFKGTTESVK